jgi:hypothetical protein
VESSRTLAPGQVAELARAFASLPWSWSAAELDQVIGRLGWTVAAGPSRSGLIAQTGLAPYNGFAEIGFQGDTVTRISVPLTDGVSEPDDRATDHLRDEFARAARALTGELGPPAERRPGPRPEIRWAVPGGFVRLWDSGVFVRLCLASTAYIGELDAVKELDDDVSDEDEW